MNLGLVANSTGHEGRPSLSTDGLFLLFDSNRSGGMGRTDLYIMRRATVNAPWTEPFNLGPTVNSPGGEFFPHLSADGSILFYMSDRPDGYGNYDIWQVPIITDGYEDPIGTLWQEPKMQSH